MKMPFPSNSRDAIRIEFYLTFTEQSVCSNCLGYLNPSCQDHRRCLWLSLMDATK